jgi:hypothetical protein
MMKMCSSLFLPLISPHLPTDDDDSDDNGNCDGGDGDDDGGHDDGDVCDDDGDRNVDAVDGWYFLPPNNRQQTADSRQQTADSIVVVLRSTRTCNSKVQTEFTRSQSNGYDGRE